MKTEECPAARFAHFVTSARYELLPIEVADWIAALVEDNLGCLLGALALPESRPIRSVSEPPWEGAPALAVGTGRAPINTAVFCNSQLANLLDFDDTYDFFIPFHPGCLIVPAALAVAESVGASGREFLTAVATAYEVALRVGRSLGDTLWCVNIPWAGFAQLGPAIAAAKLYRFDAEKIRALFSIIALDARIPALQRTLMKADIPGGAPRGSLKGNFGSMAEAAVSSAAKAKAGLNGVPGLLDWNEADWRRAGFPGAGFDEMVENLGQDYLSTQVSLKPTPSCRWTHPAITAVWDALSGRTLDASSVVRIRILGVPRLERCEWLRMVEAQFSMPCAVALAASGIEPGPKWYAEEAFRSKAISDLAGKVVQERDASAELTELREARVSCAVEIELKDGKKLHGHCKAVKGGPENPLTSSDRRAKFAANTAQLVDCGRDVRAALQELPQSSSLGDLIAALQAIAVQG